MPGLHALGPLSGRGWAAGCLLGCGGHTHNSQIQEKNIIIALLTQQFLEATQLLRGCNSPATGSAKDLFEPTERHYVLQRCMHWLVLAFATTAVACFRPYITRAVRRSSSMEFKIGIVSWEDKALPLLEDFLKKHSGRDDDEIKSITGKLRQKADRICHLAVASGESESDSKSITGVLIMRSSPIDVSEKLDTVRFALEIRDLYIAEGDFDRRLVARQLLQQAMANGEAASAQAVYMSVGRSEEQLASWLDHAGFTQKPHPLRDTNFIYHKMATKSVPTTPVFAHADRGQQRAADPPKVGAPKAVVSLPLSRPGETPGERHQRLVKWLMNLGKLNHIRHQVPLRQPYLSWIADGRKTVEGRINTGFCRAFREGDLILFKRGEGPNADLSLAHITKIVTFRDFTSMLESVGVSACLPEMENDEVTRAVDLYRSFPGYREKEKQYGTMAIHLRALSEQDFARLAQEQSIYGGKGGGGGPPRHRGQKRDRSQERPDPTNSKKGRFEG